MTSSGEAQLTLQWWGILLLTFIKGKPGHRELKGCKQDFAVTKLRLCLAANYQLNKVPS